MKVTARKTPAPKAKAQPVKPGAAKAKPAATASKTPIRTWIALIDTHAKAKLGDDDLPDYKKKAIPHGTVLTAALTGEADDHWRIKDGMVEGKALPRTIRVIEKSEWRILPVTEEAEAAADTPIDLAPADAAPSEMAPETAPAQTAPAQTAPLDAPVEPPVQAAPPAAPPAASEPTGLKICARGVRRLIPFLGAYFTVLEEGMVTARSWEIIPNARAVVAREETLAGEGKALLAKLPSLPPAPFASAINDAGADVFLLAFPWEGFFTMQKSRSTGLVLPLRSKLLGNQAFNALPYERIADKAAAAGIDEADWKFFQEEFEPFGKFDAAQFAADVDRMLTLLRGKTVIILTMNETFGADGWVLKQHARTNAIVAPLAARHGARLIDIKDHVIGIDALSHPKDNGTTFKPEIYRAIAAQVAALAEGQPAEAEAALA